MESASHHCHHEAKSLKQAWQHCRAIFRASTTSEAWCSLQQAIDALPFWALILLPVFATILVVESSLLIIPLGIIGFFWATYETVKRAVSDALRE